MDTYLAKWAESLSLNKILWFLLTWFCLDITLWACCFIYEASFHFLSNSKNLILILLDFLLNVMWVQTVKGLITKQDASSFHCISICTPEQEDGTFPLKNSLLRLCGTGHLNKVLHHHKFLTNLKTNRYTFH